MYTLDSVKLPSHLCILEIFEGYNHLRIVGNYVWKIERPSIAPLIFHPTGNGEILDMFFSHDPDIYLDGIPFNTSSLQKFYIQSSSSFWGSQKKACSYHSGCIDG